MGNKGLFILSTARSISFMLPLIFLILVALENPYILCRWNYPGYDIVSAFRVSILRLRTFSAGWTKVRPFCGVPYKSLRSLSVLLTFLSSLSDEYSAYQLNLNPDASLKNAFFLVLNCLTISLGTRSLARQASFYPSRIMN